MKLVVSRKQPDLSGLNGKNILVTGAAGFIGSHLTDLLLMNNANVIGYDNLYSGDLKNLNKALENPQFSFVEADILDKKRLMTILKEHQIKTIFHLAALTDIQSSIEDPLSTHRVNTTGTIHLVSAAIKAGVNRLIFSSSASVYGNPDKLPVHEDMVVKPISPYGASKASAEKYIQAFASISPLEYVILRYFNVYGPRQHTSRYTGVITAFIKRLLAGKPPIIYGDGTQTRNFIFVKDIIDATVMASQSSETRNSIINVASKESNSVLELAHLLQNLTKQQLRPKIQTARPGDILHSQADITRLKRTLNWTPEFDLKKGLESTLDWFKSRVNT